VELPVLHGRVVPSASENVDFPSQEASWRLELAFAASAIALTRYRADFRGIPKLPDSKQSG